MSMGELGHTKVPLANIVEDGSNWPFPTPLPIFFPKLGYLSMCEVKDSI